MNRTDSVALAGNSLAWTTGVAVMVVLAAILAGFSSIGGEPAVTEVSPAVSIMPVAVETGTRLLQDHDRVGLSDHPLNDRDAAKTFNEDAIHPAHVAAPGLAPAKPMAVLHFVKPSRYRANSGETLSVALTLMATDDIHDVTVLADAEPGLSLPARNRRVLGSIKAGRQIGVAFDVTALSEGRRYVNVVASGNTASGRRMSSYSIPVEVGNIEAVASKTAANIVIDDDGNRLILLQAETPGQGEQPR